MSETTPKQRNRSSKFPLTLHPTGQYCKKIRGKLYCFGAAPAAGRVSTPPFGSPLSGTDARLARVLSMTFGTITVSFPSALIVGKELSHSF